MKLVVYSISIGVALLFSACSQSTKQESESSEVVTESIPDIDGVSELQTPQEEVLQRELAKEELPESVVDEIEEDSLLSTLKLEKIVEITEGAKKYYDITFITEDSEDLMVSIDDQGNFIDY
ncbi:hypothetical protein GCM10007049_20960 [Echinicola pacifica]|uniref:Uncharacterized protein n=1 Tax=Echinicola pacifica TaxID=346377 RepID=A0A918PYT6_9BACT|nr:hypothetical protein [Echinicola pacifica]GGZ27904.1 hypothetical protein GCM10007049_20960 [Echinicola pacifica]